MAKAASLSSGVHFPLFLLSKGEGAVQGNRGFRGRPLTFQLLLFQTARVTLEKSPPLSGTQFSHLYLRRLV